MKQETKVFYKSDLALIANRDNRIKFLYLLYLFKFQSADDKLKCLHDDNYFLFKTKEEEFIAQIINKQEILEEEIFKFLPEDWKWERFGNLEKALLLNSAAEIMFLNQRKKIIINEAVEFAKIYCEPKAYQLVNGILDKLNFKI